jgi:hypothetical protein
MPLTPTSTNDGIVLTDLSVAITPRFLKEVGELVFWGAVFSVCVGGRIYSNRA